MTGDWRPSVLHLWQKWSWAACDVDVDVFEVSAAGEAGAEGAYDHIRSNTAAARRVLRGLGDVSVVEAVVVVVVVVN